MIRYVFCVRKRADVDEDSFRRFFSGSELESLLGESISVLQPAREARSLTLKVAFNAELMERRGTAEPFDAVMEYWWANADQLFRRLSTPEADRAMQELNAYLHQFIDFGGSHAFFTEA